MRFGVDLLRKVTGKGVVDVARYSYHETVQISKRMTMLGVTSEEDWTSRQYQRPARVPDTANQCVGHESLLQARDIYICIYP